MIRLMLIALLSITTLTGCEALFLGIEQEITVPDSDLNPPAGDTVMVSATADADVDFVRAINNGDTWTFHVTVSHPDTGWDDYADGWDVVLSDGTVLKANPDDPFTRLLLHPHETEQPFTRSQSGLVIPEGITQVTVRAHDLIHGYGGTEVTIDLTQPAGENYVIE